SSSENPCPPLADLLPPGVIPVNLKMTEIRCIRLEAEEKILTGVA
ncbi:unnamed protein product, partial [marine sediment metagenome]